MAVFKRLKSIIHLYLSVSRWRCRWLTTARVTAVFKRLKSSMHLCLPVSRCRCRWHHSHRPHDSKASRSLWSDSACDQQSVWAYSRTWWCVEHSCPVQKWQYSLTGIKMSLFFRIHIPMYLTVSTITQRWDRAGKTSARLLVKCHLWHVGQGSFVAVGHSSFVAVGQVSSVAVGQVHLRLVVTVHLWLLVKGHLWLLVKVHLRLLIKGHLWLLVKGHLWLMVKGHLWLLVKGHLWLLITVHLWLLVMVHLCCWVPAAGALWLVCARELWHDTATPMSWHQWWGLWLWQVSFICVGYKGLSCSLLSPQACVRFLPHQQSVCCCCWCCRQC